MTRQRADWHEGARSLLDEMRIAKRRAVGIKETLKAVQSDQAKAVYIAKDAEDRVLKPLRALLLQKEIAVYEVESMRQLGRACGIEVGAAAAALL